MLDVAVYKVVAYFYVDLIILVVHQLIIMVELKYYKYLAVNLGVYLDQ